MLTKSHIFSVIAFLFLLTGCDPTNPLTETEQINNGEVIRTDENCENSLVKDAFSLLCDFIPGVTCTDKVDTCNSYTRQVFMGTSLSTGGGWNHMGGRGDQMSDALMCALKELSDTKAGKQTTSTSVNVGIGNVTVTQEIGFISWERYGAMTNWPEFNGYRKLKFNLPVFGNIDAVTQNINIIKNSYGIVRDPSAPLAEPLAGSRPIAGYYGLTVTTQEKQQGLKLLPPSFEIVTPIGPFSVQPEFSYSTQAAVIDSAYDSSDARDVFNLGGVDPIVGDYYVRLNDIYGVNAGLEQTKTKVNQSNFSVSNVGWSSQLAFGNRDARVEPMIWSPNNNGPVIRPDENHLIARSGKESEPTVEVKAGANLRFPSDPRDLLPAWIFELPFLDGIDAYISINTQIRAGFADQFNMAALEGMYHRPFNEFDYISSGAAFGGLWGGVDLAANFSIIPGLRLLIALDLPFYGTKKIVDLDVQFPLHFAEVRNHAAMKTVIATSTDQNNPLKINQLQTFEQNFTDINSVNSYINQCYSATQTVPAQAAPEPSAPELGDTTKLIPEHLWPCNICVFVPDIQDPANGINISQKSEYVLPSVETPSFLCNRYEKNGCQDWCSLDKNTGKLHVVAGATAADIKGYATGTDQTDYFGGITNKAIIHHTVQSRFNGCENP